MEIQTIDFWHQHKHVNVGHENISTIFFGAFHCLISKKSSCIYLFQKTQYNEKKKHIIKLFRRGKTVLKNCLSEKIIYYTFNYEQTKNII